MKAVKAALDEVTSVANGGITDQELIAGKYVNLQTIADTE